MTSEKHLVKYPRTFHLPWSEGMTSDDKMIKSISCFDNKRVVVTEKMDGENTTMYSHSIHARSLDSHGGEDRAWVKNFWSSIKHEIPDGWRICGENLWAKHSIFYENLQSYFYGFSVWNGDLCINWEESQFYFNELGVTSVPVLYDGIWDEEKIKSLYVESSKMEGYVVRLYDEFHYKDFSTSVAKFVRKNHVQTDTHWRNSQFIPNLLST